MNEEVQINTSDYIAPSAARNYCKYSVSSLRQWSNEGKIKTIRSPGGKRFYYLPDIKALSGNSKEERTTLCYARVFSKKERENLQTQVDLFKTNFPYAEIISEISSGLEFNRKWLQYTLKKVSSGTVERVVVTNKDRLCRVGIELFEFILREHNVELLVLVQESKFNDTNESARDIRDMCERFVGKRK